MIKLISDNHADEFAGELLSYKPKDNGDLLIILGDTCLKLAEHEKYLKFGEWLLSREYDIAIVDGNHENFAYLDSCPEEKWNGGMINRISPNIIRLKRGEIYTIEDNTYFVFGGCASGAKWKAQGLWNPGDTPNEAQLANAYKNLKKADYKVDYILTHKYFCDQCLVHPGEEEYRLFVMNRFIDANVEFKRWFSGHRHEDREIDAKHRVIYNKLTEVY